MFRPSSIRGVEVSGDCVSATPSSSDRKNQTHEASQPTDFNNSRSEDSARYPYFAEGLMSSKEYKGLSKANAEDLDRLSVRSELCT